MGEQAEGEGSEPAEAPQETAEETPEELSPHEETGLDLARSLARSIAGAAQAAPTGGYAGKRSGRDTGPSSDADKRRASARRPGGKRTRGGSGAHASERDPQMLSGVVDRLVSAHGWEVDLKVHAVFGRWSRIVGEQVAQHCQPTSYADGNLAVRCDSTAWATQLRLLAPTLVRRLNEELGHGTVLTIVVEGPTAPSWTRGRFSTRDGRGPRDTYG